MLYDGECAVCTRSARWVERHDRHKEIRCVALQDAEPPAGTTRADLERELHVVEPDGRTAAGWQAVVEIARRLPALKWVPVLARVPGVDRLGTWWYRRVAGRRACADCVKDRVRSES